MNKEKREGRSERGEARGGRGELGLIDTLFCWGGNPLESARPCIALQCIAT